MVKIVKNSNFLIQVVSIIALRAAHTCRCWRVTPCNIWLLREHNARSAISEAYDALASDALASVAKRLIVRIDSLNNFTQITFAFI